MNAAAVAPFWKYELALTRHYLGAEGPEGATKLEYIDASEREIARALGRPDAEAEEAMNGFLGVFQHAGLVEALRHGRAPRVPAGLHVMGWFNYLLLSCHAAALSPSVAHSDRFRDRLQARLGLEQGLSELSGLATLWERAERWCRHRHGLGEPIRLISLPDPGNMSQIGYTVRIAFPSRLDLRRMERLFQNLPPRARATADTVVAAVRSVLAERGWSQGFRRAFDDFARRRHDGERLLEDHPFWITVRNLERPGAAADKAPHVQLELRTDFEGEATYTVTTASAVILDALGGAAAPFAADDVQSVDITEAQLLSFLGDGPQGLPDGLRRCHAEGAIPFAEATWGRWEAQRMPEAAKVRLLAKLRRQDGRTFVDPRHGAWELGPPISEARAHALLTALRGGASERSGIVAARVAGGIRMEDVFLGRPAFLPEVRAVDGCEAAVAPVGHVVGAIKAHVRGPVIELTTEAPLEGVWRIAVLERGSARTQPSFVFEPEARERQPLPIERLAANWRPEEPDPADCKPVQVSLPADAAANSDVPPPFADLMEALYAGGEKGWSERDIVQTILKCAPDRFAGWDVLRVLVDGGWMEARASTRWKARKWFLVPPRLTVSRASGRVVLEGAAPAKTVRRFHRVALGMGATTHVLVEPKAWAVASHHAAVGDPEAFATAMALPAVDATVNIPPTGQPLDFGATLYSDERRLVTSTWDWARGRFVSRGSTPHPKVSLETLSTVRPSAADIYRITVAGCGTRLLDGRNAAILVAHRCAGVPLFRFDAVKGTLGRVAAEGALPSCVARYLRLRTGRGSALRFPRAGERTFETPCRSDDAVVVGRWLGAAMTGLEDGPDERGRMLAGLALGRARGGPRLHPVPGGFVGSRQC